MVGTSSTVQMPQSANFAPATFRQPAWLLTARLNSSCFAGSPKRRRSSARMALLLPSPPSCAGTTLSKSVRQADNGAQESKPFGTGMAPAALAKRSKTIARYACTWRFSRTVMALVSGKLHRKRLSGLSGPRQHLDYAEQTLSISIHILQNAQRGPSSSLR